MSILSLPSITDDLLLDELSAADLFMYGRTCKAIHAVVQSYIPRKFQLHKLLARYFTPEEIEHFRWLQMAMGMLISGSTALQFFDRTIYPESDLDLYLEHAYREEVGRWLLKIGYTYVPRKKSGGETFDDDLHWHPDDEAYQEIIRAEFIETGKGYLGAQCVFTFAKESPYRKVQMITSTISPLDRVLNFHSTCVMNIITHDAAYALFPKGTFKERRAMACVNPTLHSDDSVAKYVRRGWYIDTTINRSQFDDPSFAFARGLRYVGDAKCWKLPILPKIDDRSPCDIKSNSFLLRYNKHFKLKISYCVIKSSLFLATYLIDPDDEHFHRHFDDEISNKITSASEGRDSEEFLDGSLTDLLNWYRAGHYASETCQYSRPGPSLIFNDLSNA